MYFKAFCDGFKKLNESLICFVIIGDPLGEVLYQEAWELFLKVSFMVLLWRAQQLCITMEYLACDRKQGQGYWPYLSLLA